MLRTVLALGLIAIVMGSYSPELANKLCRLTVASYCRKPEVERWECTPCRNSPLALENVQTFENSTMDTLGFIGTSKQMQAIVLVFRGTLPWDIKNWISDINFIAVAYPLCDNKCHVHRGFYYAFLEIKQQLLTTVSKYQQQFGYSKVIVTGHSLGGALATHATAHLLAAGVPVTDMYSFGSPRVGDTKFTIWFNERFGKNHFKARVTHGRDPVPHLPFEDWGFLHVQTEVFYHGSVKEGYKVCKDDSGKEDKNCSDSYRLDVDVLDHLTYFDIDYAGIVLACQK